METRINKYLTEAGICSRREADRWIEQKKVKINGELAVIGQKVNKYDVITIDGKPLKAKDEWVYLAYNKPVGIISTTDQNIPNNIIDAIRYPKRIFHIGRLDKESEGLILMTNDGDIVNEILRSEHHHEKEYLVKVNKPLTSFALNNLSMGVPILNTKTKPCTIQMMKPDTFKIILTEGLNRQIRRMCQYFDYEVVSLKRIRIMHIKLDIPVGKYRELTKYELKELFNRIGGKIAPKEDNHVVI